MKINSFSIKKLLNDSAQFSCGTDFLTLNLKAKIDKLSNILSVLDPDNSNSKLEILDGYPINYTKSNSKFGAYISIIISINNIPYTIGEYLEYTQKRKDQFHSEGSFTFYGTYFRLLERGDIKSSFEEAFFGDSYEMVKHFPISRIDYRLDLFFEGEYPFPDKDYVVNANKNIHSTIYTTDTLKEGKEIKINKIHIKDCKITGRDVGARSNKTVFLRMYDKLIDCKAKGKVPLYDDYFNFKTVYRLEGEFRTKFNKNLNTYKEDSPMENMYREIVKIDQRKKRKKEPPRNYNYGEFKELENKCASFLCLNDKTSKKFTYQYKENKNKDNIDFRYYRDFCGRGCKIALMGGNPFKVLLNQFMYIDSIRDQISKELLETLLLDFNQHNMKLIEQKILFNSDKNGNESNTK